MQAPTRKSMTSSSGLSPGSPFQFLTNTLTGQPTGLHSISRTPTSDTSINCKPTTPPDPYVWNESFKVAYPRLDQEHVGLFEGMLAVEKDLGSKQKLDHLKKVVGTISTMRRRNSATGMKTFPRTTVPGISISMLSSAKSWLPCTPLSPLMTSNGPKTGWPSTSRSQISATKPTWSTPCRSHTSGTTPLRLTTADLIPSTTYCSPTSSPSPSTLTTPQPWLPSRRT